MGELFSNPLHLLLLIVVIVLLFGATKLGDVGGALGKSIREFKKEANNPEELRTTRVVTPPTAGYVPPVTQTHSYQPEAGTQQSIPGYVSTEPVRRPDTVPGDYRPASPSQTPPASGSLPPDYSGR